MWPTFSTMRRENYDNRVSEQDRHLSRTVSPSTNSSQILPLTLVDELLAIAQMRFEHVNGPVSGSLNAAVIGEIRGHSRRTAQYALRLATEAASQPVFQHECDGMDLKSHGLAALFHDFGKAAIPVAILGKSVPLDADEYSVMKAHTLHGGWLSIGSVICGRCPSAIGRRMYEVALFHHERWDGTGYPYGLARQQIPFSARLLAIADTYDAIVHRRVYRAAQDHDNAVRVIEEGRGRQFDPQLADLFMTVADDFAAMTPSGSQVYGIDKTFHRNNFLQDGINL